MSLSSEDSLYYTFIKCWLQESIVRSGFSPVGLIDEQTEARELYHPMKQPGQDFYTHLREVDNWGSQTCKNLKALPIS